MPNGHRGDLRVGGRAAARAVAIAHKPAPYDGRTAVERQDALVELLREVLFDPSLESLATFLFPHLPGALHEFSDGLGGKKEVRRILGFDPVEHGLLRSWPDGLADNIGIEKKGHQSSSAERPADLSRSNVGSASVRGEARRKATNSAPVRAFGTRSAGSNDRRMRSASSPPERRAPASALTRGASPEGTVTSTRRAPPIAVRLRWRATRDASSVFGFAGFKVCDPFRLRFRNMESRCLQVKQRANVEFAALRRKLPRIGVPGGGKAG